MLVLTLLIGVLSLAIAQTYTRFSLLEHFREIDEREAVESLNRSLDIIQSEIRHLRSIARNIAANSGRESDSGLVMNTLNLDFMAVAEGGDSMNDVTGVFRHQGQFTDMPNIESAFDEVLKGPFAETRVSEWGFVRSRENDRHYLLALGHSGDTGRTVIVGRRLKPIVQRYTNRTMSVVIEFNDGTKTDEAGDRLRLNESLDFFPVFNRATGNEVTFAFRDDGRIHSWISVDVPYIEGGLEIHLSKTADTYIAGIRELRKLQVVYLAAYVVFLGILFLGLVRNVYRPFRNLLAGIDTWDGLRLPDLGGLKDRRDEIGLLADTFSDMASEIMKTTRTLEEQAVRDALTGLLNRRRFDEAFNSEWKRHDRMNATLAIIMADIDNFKIFNDTYGHPEGDLCLRKVATAIEKTLKRPGDILFRYGGEEFIILLAETDANGAGKVAEELRRTIADLRIPNIGSGTGLVTISLGTAAAVPERGAPGDDRMRLLGQVDQALYSAKKNGRNRVVVAGE